MSGPADNTPTCPVCGFAPQVRGCKPGKCRTLPNDAHPLPWRWVDGRLIDARGFILIIGIDPGGAVPVSPYVRAVTERSRLLETLVRKHQFAASFGDMNKCPECEAPEGQPHNPVASLTGGPCAIGTVLADIDAAKAGG